MIDEHLIPNPEWGVKPILFHIGNFSVPSYSFFIGLALLVGILIYWLEARRQKSADENGFYVIIATLLGGAIGAKLLVVILYWNQIVASFPDLTILLSGKSIVGGLIGGFIAILIIKYKLGIKGRRGNLFAPAIAIGVAIGRIGCFLRGCCFGKETSLPWGVNFGDGLLRHPTQIYESIFMLGMFIFLIWKRKQNPKPGSLFKILMISYFSFRFLIEFIRTEPIVFLGLTWFQFLSLSILAYFIFIKKN